MVTIYTSPSCSSCRKVKKWFKEQKIPFKEKNIFSSVLNPAELKEILSKTENGTDDIISKRSLVFKEKNIDLNNLSINELVNFIRENPSILRRPIIVDDRRVQVGYNPDEIRTFIPLQKRLEELFKSLPSQCESCETGDSCDHGKIIS